MLLIAFAGFFAAGAEAGLLRKGAPAGQMCPEGSYVIGFDSEANIICTEACGNGVLNDGEACDDGNRRAGDGCSPECEGEGSGSASGAAAAGAAAAGATGSGAPESAPSGANEASNVPITEAAAPLVRSVPVIADVGPSKVLFGTRELTLTIVGKGFTADSLVIFDGKRYEPAVNQAGTRLQVTIPTRHLSIASYAVTVSNGEGLEDTMRRALDVY